MTPRDFCYWLQGYFELRQGKITYSHAQEGGPMLEPDRLDSIQTEKIKDHLALVFEKHTPDRTGPECTIPDTTSHFEVMPTCGSAPFDGFPVGCGISIKPEKRGGPFDHLLNDNLRCADEPPGDPIQKWLNDDDAPVSC